MKTIKYHGMELLPIKSDIVFKVIFGKVDSRDILARFLSAILDIEIDSPEDIELTNTEISPDFKDDKLSRFDIRVKLHDGTHIEIEIQLRNNDDMIPRSIYYQAKLFQSQMVKGMKYEQLGKAITLNIIDYNIFEGDEFLNCFRYHNIESQNELTSLSEINFLELGKVPKQWYNEKQMWSLFISTENEEVLDMLSEENKYIEKAVKKLAYVSADESERFRIEQIEKARMDYESQLKVNYDRGMKQGIEQGVVIGEETGARKKAIQIAKSILVDYEDKEISEITGLSVEDVANLRNAD